MISLKYFNTVEFHAVQLYRCEFDDSDPFGLLALWGFENPLHLCCVHVCMLACVFSRSTFGGEGGDQTRPAKQRARRGGVKVNQPRNQTCKPW